MSGGNARTLIGKHCNSSNDCCGGECKKPIVGGGSGPLKCTYGTWYGTGTLKGKKTRQICCRYGGCKSAGGCAGLEKDAWGHKYHKNKHWVNSGDCSWRAGDPNNLDKDGDPRYWPLLKYVINLKLF